MSHSDVTGSSAAELSNDHKAITDKIGKLIQELHAAKQLRQPESRPSAPTAAADDKQADRVEGNVTHASAASPGQQPRVVRPFALIDSVSEASPASTAGIQVRAFQSSGSTPCCLGSATCA